MTGLNLAGPFLALLLSAFGAFGANAGGEDPEAAKKRIGSGNPTRGKTLSETELCQGCHGETGIGVAVGVPNLAGQYAAYLVKELQDFRGGARRHRIMTAMAEGLADADLPDIAAYFASQPRMKGAGSHPQSGARELFLYGDVNRNLDACVNCHDLGGVGRLANGIAYPAIAGQNKGYLRVQLLNWKIGARGNSPGGVMNKIAGALSEQEIAELADLISGLSAEPDAAQ